MALGASGTAFTITYNSAPISSGTLGISQSQTLTLTPVAGIPSTSATTTDGYSNTITISTDAANDIPHVITLHQTAYGAILALSPSSASFTTPPSTTTTQPFSVTNSGDAPAAVTLSFGGSNPTQFGANPNTASAVTAAAPLNTTVTYTAPSTAGTGSATLNVGAGSTVLCAPLPTAATLSATALAGTVVINAASVNFGQVNCGTAANARTVVVSNPGTQAYTITSSLRAGQALLTRSPPPAPEPRRRRWRRGDPAPSPSRRRRSRSRRR